MDTLKHIMPKNPKFEMPSESILNDIREIFKKFFKDEEVYNYACIAFYISELASYESKEKAEESIKQLAEHVRLINKMNSESNTEKKENKDGD